MTRSKAQEKLSQYKIDKIIKCFVYDLTVSEAYLEVNSNRKSKAISKKTIGIKYQHLRKLFISGSVIYPELFGGAGALLCIGAPPKDLTDIAEELMLHPTDKNKNGKPKKRIKKYNLRSLYLLNEGLYFWMERMLRLYMWRNLSHQEIWVIIDFSIHKFYQRIEPKTEEGFDDWGMMYLAEINWSSLYHDFGMREMELWNRVYSKDARSDFSYFNIFFRDMKWLLKRFPVGKEIMKKASGKHIPHYKDRNAAAMKWFPNGYFKEKPKD